MVIGFVKVDALQPRFQDVFHPLAAVAIGSAQTPAVAQRLVLVPVAQMAIGFALLLLP